MEAQNQARLLCFFLSCRRHTNGIKDWIFRSRQPKAYVRGTAKDSITADCSYTKVTIRKLPRLCGREGCSQLSYTCITPVPPALGRWRAVALADETRTTAVGSLEPVEGVLYF